MSRIFEQIGQFLGARPTPAPLQAPAPGDAATPCAHVLQVIKAQLPLRNREEFWARVFAAIDARSLCEIGVYKGAFAEHILRACEGLRAYHMVDPWRHLDDWDKPANHGDAQFEALYAEAMSRTAAFAGKRVVHRATTREAAAAIPDGGLDAVYIDGDHSLRGITIDLIAMLPKLRHGGLLAGDDFTRNIWQHGTDFAPTEVFPFALYFAEATGRPIFTLPGSQFCIVNDPGTGFRVFDFGDYLSLSPREIYLPRAR